MTILGKHVIMKETLIVIISGREGSAPMVEKTIRRHSERSEESAALMRKRSKDYIDLLQPFF